MEPAAGERVPGERSVRQLTSRRAYGQRQLELTITNPTSGNGAGEPVDRGYGILGMHERAALLGGSLRAGAHDGRFRVTAGLPYAAAARARQ